MTAVDSPRVTRLAGLALTLLVSWPAAADPPRLPGQVRVGGGVFARPTDAAESRFWRDRGPEDDVARLMPIPAPPRRGEMERWPSPLPPTRNGPTTMDDLHLRPDGRGGLAGERPGFHFAIARDGRIAFQDRAGFDLTDFLMRLNGEDPYSYDKHLVRRMTEPMRVAMTDADRRRTMAQALRELPDRLDAIWKQPVRADERRALLFLLWDECLEPDGPEAPAGARARATIEDFARSRLPAGSPDAFTPAELLRLNQGRRSRAPFAPYAP
jgi:hypothetical protein